jgi:hypothetical protein
MKKPRRLLSATATTRLNSTATPTTGRYQGIICLVQVVEGTLKVGDKVRFFHAGKTHEVQELGLLTPGRLPLQQLRTGQVGYVVPGFREMAESRCGETICSPEVVGGEATGLAAAFEPLPGFAPAKAMVFASMCVCARAVCVRRACTPAPCLLRAWLGLRGGLCPFADAHVHRCCGVC